MGEKGISSDQLRQLIDQSGLFLESKLALGIAPSIDLKSSLLRLLFSLRPTLSQQPTTGQSASAAQQSIAQNATANPMLRTVGEIHSQAESALARINMNQLASVPNDQDGRQVWQLELPIKHQEQSTGLMMRIEREPKPGQSPEQAFWSVLINFNLEPVGPISAKIGLINDEVTSHFIAERNETAHLIDQALPILNDAFEQAGLAVKRLSVLQGEPENFDILSNHNQQLLDEKA